MSVWTAEKLDALPEGTVVAWDGESYSWGLKENPDNHYCWTSDCGDRWSSEEVFRSARPGSIRVVSVPIEALMSEGALDAAWDTFDRDGHNGIECRPEESMSRTVSNALRAAINHATRQEGEA